MLTSIHRPTTEASRAKWVQFWLLEKTGLAELRQVAQKIGIPRCTLTNVINGSRHTPWIQAKIAKLAGRPAGELFGPHTHWSLLQKPQRTRKAS